MREVLISIRAVTIFAEFPAAIAFTQPVDAKTDGTEENETSSESSGGLPRVCPQVMELGAEFFPPIVREVAGTVRYRVPGAA